MFKLQRSDLVLALLGLAGVLAIFVLYEDAFPLAAVDMEVTRDEAIASATELLVEQGAELDDYRRAALFSGDSEALVFLQRTLGTEEASRWARSRVDVWTWDIRWFRPGETEEWLAFVGVDGDISGFRRILEEAAAGASLDETGARAVAETFLTDQGWDLAELEPIQASADQKDNRVDHVFTWQVAGSEIAWRPDDPEAGTGSIRVRVLVQGDTVGGYASFLRVPEEFAREFESVQSRGQLLAIASIVLTVLMALGAMAMAIVRYRTGDVDWRTAIVAGGIVGTMFVAYSVTAWPAAQFRYETHIDWAVFLALLGFGLILAGIFYTVFVMFPTAAGASVAREFYPESLRGFAAAMRGRIFTREFGAASLRGYALAAALMGFFTAFYWFARNYMGAWMPAEGPYSEIFNNMAPALTPLTISLVAAISEETIYRLFGISVFRKLTGSRWAALVIPAAIWAFGHSNYPVFPVYVRGIELTIAGTLFGLAFLRYGLVACIVAHYVIDAVALGLPLLGSGSTSYVISGAVVIGLALVPGVVGFLAGRDTEPEPAGEAVTT